jgi:hypothetical protein
MSLKTFLVLALAGLAAPRPASAQTAAAPELGGMTFASARAAAAAAAEQVQTWDLASNNSNAREIYSLLLQSGARPACHEKRIAVNGEWLDKQDCSVTARVARLTVKINDIVWSSTTDVDVVGETTCENEWLVVARGRRQAAELWQFCQLKGVARPK